MNNEIKEICKNCKYHYIEEISFDYPQSCCNKTTPNHTTEEFLHCDNFEYSKDYITNLQQEKYELERDNKHLNGLLDTALNEQDRLQNENEKLKEEHNQLRNCRKYDLNLISNLKHDKVRYEEIIEKASEFIKEKISSTKGVINDYMYHKEHNKILIELLNEDIEMYKNELNILQNGSDDNE